MNRSKQKAAVSALEKMRRDYSTFLFSAQAALEAIEALDPQHHATDHPHVRAIIEEVCEVYGVMLSTLLSPARHEEIAEARHLAMLLCREFTNQNTTALGRAFHRDHGSISHGSKHARELIATEPGFRGRYERIRATLAARFEAEKKTA